MKIRLILLSILFIPFWGIAQNSNNELEVLLQNFSHCDSRFFSELNKSQYSKYFHLTSINSKQSNITTETSSSSLYSDDRIQQFIPSIKFNNLNITQYKDIRSVYAEDEKYYFWGFIFNNSIQEVKKAFSWINWHKDTDQQYIYHPLIYKNGKWQENPYAAGGIEPDKNTAEKLLILESNGATVSIFCTIQGNIPAKELAKIRPDLK